MPHLLHDWKLKQEVHMEKMSSNKNLASLIFTKCTIKWVMSLWNLRNFSKSCFEYEIESCLQVNIITKITVKTPFIFHVRKVESQKNSINSVRSFFDTLWYVQSIVVVASPPFLCQVLSHYWFATIWLCCFPYMHSLYNAKK